MNRQFLINEINHLIEANRLWNEMNKHINAFGGELWESGYAKAYSFHEELVFNLIMKYHGCESFSESEFDAFQEIIYNLSRNNTATIITAIDDELNYQTQCISNAEDLLNFFLT